MRFIIKLYEVLKLFNWQAIGCLASGAKIASAWGHTTFVECEGPSFDYAIGSQRGCYECYAHLCSPWTDMGPSHSVSVVTILVLVSYTE